MYVLGRGALDVAAQVHLCGGCWAADELLCLGGIN